MEAEFYPLRTPGTLLQGGLILILRVAGVDFFFRSTQNPSGANFLLGMLIALMLFALLPLMYYWLGYRGK
jgi:hypothetical protein